MTLVSSAIIVALLISEVSEYLAGKVESHLDVDTEQASGEITISLDIVFYHLRCSWVELEVQDSKGALVEDARIHLTRSPYPPTTKGLFGNMFNRVASRGSTVGAAATAAAAGGAAAETNEAEGCQLKGTLEVNRGAGNFHIVPSMFSVRGATPGAGVIPGMGTMGMPPQQQIQTYNSSHKINRLSFGPPFPGQVNPLDNAERFAEGGPAQLVYYVQVVPTQYEYSFGRPTRSAQFSVNEFTARSDPNALYMIPPGFVVRYDFSPILIRLRETRQGLLAFLTSLCAIVGGVFAVSGMIDSAIHKTIESMGKHD